MAEKKFVKIGFELQRDKDGYPPSTRETLWAIPCEQTGFYRIDSIPFYVKGISSEDVVLAEPQHGQLKFIQLIQPSANSVVRIYVADAPDVQAARASFCALGCESEQSHIPKLFALEIPGSAAIEPVDTLLEEGAASGRWEYEEGVMRHQIPE